MEVIKKVGLDVECHPDNPNAVTITKKGGKRETRAFKDLKFDRADRLICDLLVEDDHGCYIQVGDSYAHTYWVNPSRVHDVSDETEISPSDLSSLMNYLDNLNTKLNGTFSLKVWSDGSGHVYNEDDEELVFSFNSKDEFERMAALLVKFQTVKRAWQNAGLTYDDVANFMGYEILD